MTEQTPAAAGDSAAQQAQFTVEKIYVKDVSFEAPNAPAVFNETGQPQLSMNLNQKVDRLEGDLFEVVLGVTTSTRSAPRTQAPRSVLACKASGNATPGR
jgi:preprotein translocase subunit SecB